VRSNTPDKSLRESLNKLALEPTVRSGPGCIVTHLLAWFGQHIPLIL